MAKDKTKVEMTITRALTTLKLLDKRIAKATNKGVFVSLEIDGQVDSKDFAPKEALASVTDLIAYRASLKSAIMSSNSKTNVKIGTVTMKVVEAIEQKSTIVYKRNLLGVLTSQLARATRTKDSINERVQERLDELLKATFGKDTKISEGDYDRTSEPFLKKNAVAFADKIGIEKVISDLEEEIDTFEAEVDLCLSESNALTTIKV